jgi:hypothetical protein
MTDADDITRYQDEAADDFNVTLRVEPTVDGRFEALALPMLGKPPSSTTRERRHAPGARRVSHAPDRVVNTGDLDATIRTRTRRTPGRT